MVRRLLLLLALFVAVPPVHADTILHYNFDEGPLNQPASVVLDSGPNNIQGIAHNIGTAGLPIYRSAASPGFWLQLSGNGEALPTAASYIEVSDPGVSPLDLTGPLTVEAVIRPTLKTGIDDMEIVRKKGGLAGSGYFLTLQGDGRVVFRLQDDLTAAVSAIPLQPNNTYHVAGTWDGSTIRVYVDYALQGQFAYNGPLVANNDKLGIGALLRINNTVDHGFAGFMDSVRISNVALVPGEFLDIPEPTSVFLVVMTLAIATGWRRPRS
jgi:hypothetical protein